MKQTRSLSEFSCLSEYTRLYPSGDLKTPHTLCNNPMVSDHPVAILLPLLQERAIRIRAWESQLCVEILQNNYVNEAKKCTRACFT